MQRAQPEVTINTFPKALGHNMSTTFRTAIYSAVQNAGDRYDGLPFFELSYNWKRCLGGQNEADRTTPSTAITLRQQE